MRGLRATLAVALTVAGLGGGPVAVAGLCGQVAADPPPADIVQCEGAAPGMRMSIPGRDDPSRSSPCTMGFVYRGSDGETYASMTGGCHLATARPAPVAYAARRGPIFLGSRDRRMGEVAFAVNDGRVDFGLVRLFRGVSYSPQACHWGGPTGVETRIRSEPMTLKTLASVFAAPGLLPDGADDAHRVEFRGSPFDSGIAMTETGAVVGTVRYGQDGLGTQIERPARGLALAERTLRIRLTLLTAPLID